MTEMFYLAIGLFGMFYCGYFSWKHLVLKNKWWFTFSISLALMFAYYVGAFFR